ncbi:MAG: hypothetical protein ABJC39_07300 [Chloroflexota bacterium]
MVGALERICEALAWADGDGETTAVGWATVELDRAAAELAHELGVTPDAFVPAADSVALGAGCRVAPGVLPGGLALAILEPNIEGRLAAALARLGEGPVAIWSAIGAGAAPHEPAASPGPFGPERLVPGAPAHGPHRFLIGTAAGTIRP